MLILVNGEKREMEPTATIQGLLEELGMESERVAVAVNASVVPRRELGMRRLAEGDRVDVIEAVGGG
jgi:sulfur carrier protein